MERKEAEWSQRLSEARAIGQRPAEIARVHGVTLSTVYSWSRRLRQKALEGPPRTSTASPGRSVAAPSALTFARVERTPHLPPDGPSSRGIVVEVGAARVRVERAEDAALAAEVVRALSALEAR
jgi:transposase-like protein